MQMNKPKQFKKIDVSKTPGFQMLPPELQNVAISTAEGKYQAQIAADGTRPLNERFNAVREVANNMKYVKGNTTNFRNRMGYGKGSGTSYNKDPETYRQPGTGSSDRPRPTSPYVRLPNLNVDTPTGGSSGGSSGGNNSYNSFEQVFGYSVINDSNTPTSFSTALDTSLYENPYKYQDKPKPDTSISARTIVNVIDPLFMYSSKDTIFQEIYAGLKMEVNSNTNGGNQVTDTKFTQTNLYNYLKDVWNALFYLVELMSRQAWATEDINTNKVLREQAYFLTSDPSMLSMRNYMASTLSNFVIPKGMYDYAYWLLQVYQTNTFKHAVDQVFVSSYFATYMYGVTDDASALTGYKSLLTSAVNPLKANVELYSQISALLQSKTSSQWVNCRYIRKPSNTTHFDPAFNDIFSNQAFIGKYIKGEVIHKCFLPPTATEPDTVPVVFSTDISKVQCHVMETFLAKYNTQPLLYHASSVGTVSLGNKDFEGFNKFVLFQDNNSRKFAAIQRKEFFNQVGNDALTIKVGYNSSSVIDEQWFIMPRGNQHYLYDVAYPACVLAQRMTAAKLFA